MAYINRNRIPLVLLKGDSAFIRYSSHPDGTDFTETRSEGQTYIGFATGQTAPTEKEAYTWVFLGTQEANEAVRNSRVGKVRVNEFNKDNTVVGYLQKNNTINNSTDVFVTTNYLIPVVAGEAITITPKCYKIGYYDTAQNFLTVTDHSQATTITVEQDGYIKVTVYTKDIDSVMIEHSSTASGVYTAYNVIKMEEGVDFSEQQKAYIKQQDDEISAVTDEAIKELVKQYPQAFQSEHNGYMNSLGNISLDPNCRCVITQKIPCIEGDAFFYKGNGKVSAYSWIFYNGDNIVSAVQYAGETVVVIPSGVNGVRFSSFKAGSNELVFDLYKIDKVIEALKQKDNEILEITDEAIKELVKQNPQAFQTEQDGFMTSSGTYSSASAYHSITTQKIPCTEGDVFTYNGRGQAQACSWIFYDGESIVSAGQYKGATTVTIPSGVNGVRFSSFAELANEVTLEVVRASSTSNDTEQSNVLYGKKYVAVGDSYTAGAFAGFVDENGLTGTDSPVIYDTTLQMYKTYPWWIAKRNSMTLINQGNSGGTMALTKAYLDGDQDITYRLPYSNERYKSVPADANYLTIWFGINDSSQTNLGTANDTTNETFYGAYNVVLEWLLINRPALKIGLIVTPRASATYRQAVRDIGKRWGIPVLDMMGEDTPTLFGKEEGLCATAQQIYDNKFRVSADNSHPNILAHENISTYIEAFLRRL